MRIRMLADHDYRLKPVVFQAFKAGREYNVPRATAEALIDAGAAEKLTATKKD